MEDTIDLFHLRYSDLVQLSADEIPESPGENHRLQLISDQIMHNLGPNGPGLLSIIGVPKAQLLRQTLLPLARKLALLSNNDRKRILKEYNLGSDVPLKNLDRIVSSFAMQMKYDQEFDGKFCESMAAEADGSEFSNLGLAFHELGSCMMELGLLLSRVCDKKLVGCDLEQCLLECGTAKARLIHYHSILDNMIIKEKCWGKGRSAIDRRNFGIDDGLNLWQKWHYDYGIFTILTAPMFMLSDGSDVKECNSPMCHTYLQILHPRKGCVLSVKAAEGSFVVQVGESADVLSQGKLRATLHCVSRPAKMDNVSRETFAMFLQPAWNKTFSLKEYPIEHLNRGDQNVESECEGTRDAENESDEMIRNISRMVPPLSSRLKDGMTFADFAKETTRKYYGGSGSQSSR
ncbi:hypothetical protein F511_09052 [Dorcoceras hygrometricum]|uniref:Isopenicillin N synthase-like Fe(2+) 2OG dioxygenase domain-containing protein n=1 Tax=Dorcoceras hygrometricum TaxID=472368 RepID=A0A2Z7AN05_9LAMI|nr:hypothetical protein F511_09052 [Dorcoceras hygrometricum]